MRPLSTDRRKEYVEMTYTYSNGYTETRFVKLENFRKALTLCRISENLF